MSTARLKENLAITRAQHAFVFIFRKIENVQADQTTFIPMCTFVSPEKSKRGKFFEGLQNNYG